MIDVHFHWEKEELRETQLQLNTQGLLSLSSPNRYQKEKKLLKKQDKIKISYGIHPWKSDQFYFEEAVPILLEVPVVGEVGLDKVWTEVPLKIQTEALEKQLSFAMNAQKPVILHSKGTSKEILTEMRRYPNVYLLHWLSDKDRIEDFLTTKAYFSIGPDLNKEPAVKHLAKEVALDRLLIESDGLESMGWALDKKEVHYQQEMEKLTKQIAELRGLSVQELKEAFKRNYDRFLSRKL